MVDKEKRAARQRAAETGEAYTTALRAVRLQQRPTPPALEGPGSGAKVVYPYILGTWRDGDQRIVEAREWATWDRVGIISVPWCDGDQVLDEWRAAGLVSSGRDEEQMIRHQRPDLLAWRLGMDAHSFGWHEWSDGILRTDVKALGRNHIAEASPLAPGQTSIGAITVREYPAGTVVAHVVLDEPLPMPTDGFNSVTFETSLREHTDRLGYSTARWGWRELPGGVRIAAALPGRLAERGWWREAKVRFLRDVGAAAPDLPDGHVFQAGTVQTMLQYGEAGSELDRDTWVSSTDIDLSLYVPADAVEVVEIVHDDPPFWAEAAIGVDRIVELLGPHHEGAAEAAAAWIAAGLHVADDHWGIEIRTPAPEYRLVGKVGRDYWDKMRHTKPYEAIVVTNTATGYEHPVRFKALPLDPVALVGRARELLEAEWAKWREDRRQEEEAEKQRRESRALRGRR